MTDPYATLGVPRDAPPKDIEKAYKRRARDLHPDRGGDPEKFRELKLAYDILRNPARRARYDATGDASEAEADNSANAVILTLQHALTGVLGELLSKGYTVGDRDLINDLRLYIEKGREARRQALKDFDRIEACIRDTLPRITEEPDLLGAVLRQQLHMLGENRKALEAQGITDDQALEHLKRCKFRRNILKPEPAGSAASMDQFLAYLRSTQFEVDP